MRDSLVVSDANRKAVEFLDDWPNWPGPVAILAGPVGCGKSHLAQIWASRADATIASLRSTHAASTEPDRPVVVEDVARGGFSEIALFHLINAVTSAKIHLLLTSRRWPGDWGITLPDLHSRMKLATLLEMGEPDDALLRGVMMKLFADRQLAVEPAVINYLMVRMERSLAAAQDLVAALDEISLADKRSVTVPLASQVLERLQNGND
ncbi:MAG: hypothetical protein OXR62_09950 [Ahrensia sp.]|nr:hypothetical protein [Ahrensia sp.]